MPIIQTSTLAADIALLEPMFSRHGKRGYSVQEEFPDYRIDFDSDSDFDPDGTPSPQDVTGQSATRPVVESEGGDKP
jgi:hypothetical protein